MTDAELQRAVYELYAAHFVLNRAGIEPAEIFVSVDMVQNAEPPGHYACVVAIRGENKFVFWTAPIPNGRDRRRFLKAWSKFSSEQPKMSRIDLDIIVVTSRSWQMRRQIVEALRGKGFEVVDAEMLN